LYSPIIFNPETSSGQPRSVPGQALSADAALHSRDTDIESSSGDSYSRWLLWLWRHPRLHMFLLEFRSFFQRSRIVWSRSQREPSHKDFVWLRGDDGRSYLNTRRCGRSENIEKISSIHPWATPVDWELWRQSWDEGVEWAIRNLDFGSPSTSAHKALLASEPTYSLPHVRRQGAILQSTKHDLPDLPPSQA
jgi:hypothetical protein